MAETASDLAPPLASSPALQGERVAFTGTLASMTHRQAMDLTEQHGGQAMQHVSQNTTLLVIGEEGWPLEENGKPSVKLEAAQLLLEQGIPIRILSESEWLTWVGVATSNEKGRQLYTPAMLSQLLNIPVLRIRAWERAGLIHPVQRIFRLPYFDFQEVTGVRRLAELVKAGVPIAQIGSGLKRLRQLLPQFERPLAQLEILAHDQHVLYRDEDGLLEPESGQRVFDFEHREAADAAETDAVAISQYLTNEEDRNRWGADEWFVEACQRLELNDLKPAIAALRKAILLKGRDPVYHFHLADALYRDGNVAGAVERYRVAVECDHAYIEAWTQLGCVLAQTGDVEGAKAAFEAALAIHPDYPDAHLHLAELFHQLGQTLLARPHWKRYLQFDQRGPWASMARERLGDEGPEVPEGDGGPGSDL